MGKQLGFIAAMVLGVTACEPNTQTTGTSVVASTTYSVFGRVTAGGAPVPQARVRVSFGEGTVANTVYADSDGKYTFPGLKRGVELEAWTPGYYPTFVFITSADPFGVNFALDAGQSRSIGDTFHGALQAGSVIGLFCDLGVSFFPPPCLVYRIIPETSGSVDVSVLAPSCSALKARILTRSVDAPIPQVSPGLFNLRASVVAGETYELRVESD